MPEVHRFEFARGQLFGGQVELIGDSGEQVAINLQTVIAAAQPDAPEEGVHLDRREPPVEEQGRARAHVESSWEVVVDTGEIDEQHTARLQNANRMIESRLDVVDEVRHERIDQTVPGVRGHMISTAQIRDHRDLAAVRAEIDGVDTEKVRSTVPSDGRGGANLEPSASNVGPVAFEKRGPVVPNDGRAALPAVPKRAKPSELHAPQSPHPREA